MSATVVHQFQEQAVQCPGNVAVVDSNRSISYSELDTLSNQWAHFFAAQGIGPMCRIGVCLERGVDLPILLLGILKAGAGYVPLVIPKTAQRSNRSFGESEY